jgi:hypothetical protein
MFRAQSPSQSTVSSQHRQATSMDAWRFSPMRTASQSTLAIPSIYIEEEEEESELDEATVAKLWDQVGDIEIHPSTYEQVPRRTRSHSFSSIATFSSTAANPSSSVVSLQSAVFTASETARVSSTAFSSVYSLSSLMTKTSRQPSLWPSNGRSPIPRVPPPKHGNRKLAPTHKIVSINQQT